MQKINLGQKTLGFIPVPEGVTIDIIGHIYTELCYWNGSHHTNDNLIHLREFRYYVEIIGIAKDLTEQQWAGIVERNDDGLSSISYMVYNGNCGHVDTATESGLSLLLAHRFNHQNVLIIEIK